MNDGLWVYLSTSPLLWLSGTLFVWIIALGVANLLPANPLLNPVLLSVSAIVCLLSVFHIRYESYFAGAQFIHFLLGPATVALGIPLYEKLFLVRANLLPMVVALFAGSLTSSSSIRR
jgi:putative effector of murein hydrolase